MHILLINGHHLPKTKKAKCFGSKKFRMIIGELPYLESYIDLNEDKIEVYHLEPLKTINEDWLLGNSFLKLNQVRGE